MSVIKIIATLKSSNNTEEFHIKFDEYCVITNDRNEIIFNKSTEEQDFDGELMSFLCSKYSNIKYYKEIKPEEIDIQLLYKIKELQQSSKKD